MSGFVQLSLLEELVVLRPVEPEPVPEPTIEPSYHDELNGGLALFGRGQYAEQRDVSATPEIEHAHLPQAAARDRRPTLTLSFETTNKRDALIRELDVRVVASGASWACSWPPGVEDLDVPRLDLEGAA